MPWPHFTVEDIETLETNHLRSHGPQVAQLEFELGSQIPAHISL
jgi:hypothetical protein